MHYVVRHMQQCTPVANVEFPNPMP
jgi:hypothetical protein